MINQSPLTSTVLTSDPPNGPGGNRIVPNPATPNDWPKMLLAIGIIAGGLWALSTVWDERGTTWLAVIIILGMLTYYETHDNKRFSQGIQAILGAIK